MNETALLQHPVLRCLRRALAELSLLDGPLLLAVSGGRDSTAMAGAMALLQRRNELGLLRMAHVHHHQREASDLEAAQVEQLGNRLSLPVDVLHLDLGLAATPATLREARYGALTEAANASRADAVVTAHHAEDQLETMLLALARGSGPRGLAGMEAARSLDEGLVLARPLLQVTRGDLTDLCGQMELPFCDDPGNEDPTTHRGRLRRDVLPALEALHPGVAARAAAMAPVHAASAGAFASLLPKPAHGAWSREQLARLPHAVVLAALHAAAVGLVVVDALSTSTLSEAASAVGDAYEHHRLFEVGGGVAVVVDAQRVTINC